MTYMTLINQQTSSNIHPTKRVWPFGPGWTDLHQPASLVKNPHSDSTALTWPINRHRSQCHCPDGRWKWMMIFPQNFPKVSRHQCFSGRWHLWMLMRSWLSSSQSSGDQRAMEIPKMSHKSLLLNLLFNGIPQFLCLSVNCFGCCFHST